MALHKGKCKYIPAGGNVLRVWEMLPKRGHLYLVTVSLGGTEGSSSLWSRTMALYWGGKKSPLASIVGPLDSYGMSVEGSVPVVSSVFSVPGQTECSGAG